MKQLPEDRMPEAEVSLRLALYLVRNQLTVSDVEVAIDGAQVKNLDKVQFPINSFFEDENMVAEISRTGSWQGKYSVDDCMHRINIHSTPGLGDVVAQLSTGKLLRIESKNGKLHQSKSSPEYPLIREAIGQIMTTPLVDGKHLLGIAVPHSEKFAELCIRWQESPLIQQVGILLLRVHRSGEVDGLSIT